MKLAFLEPIAPPLRLLRDDALRPVGAIVVRWLARLVHPFDSGWLHLRIAFALAWLERR